MREGPKCFNDDGPCGPDDLCHPEIGDHDHVASAVHVWHSAAVSLLPSQNMGVEMAIPDVISQPGIAYIIEKKTVGKRRLEPLTSTVCRKRRKNVKHR